MAVNLRPSCGVDVLSGLAGGVVVTVGVVLFTHPARKKHTRVSNPTVLRGIEVRRADRVLYMVTYLMTRNSYAFMLSAITCDAPNNVPNGLRHCCLFNFQYTHNTSKNQAENVTTPWLFQPVRVQSLFSKET